MHWTNSFSFHTQPAYFFTDKFSARCHFLTLLSSRLPRRLSHRLYRNGSEPYPKASKGLQEMFAEDAANRRQSTDAQPVQE